MPNACTAWCWFKSGQVMDPLKPHCCSAASSAPHSLVSLITQSIPLSNPTKKSLESIWSGSERERVASAPNWIGAGGHWLCGTMGEWTGKFSLAEVPVIIRHKKGNSPRSNAFSTCFVLSMDCTVRRAEWLTLQPPCKEGLNCNWWGSLWLQDSA